MERISYQDAPKGLIDGLLKSSNFLKTTGLDDKLQELVKNRVSQINGCAFCLDMHFKDAIQLGETEQRIYSLPAWKVSPYYSDAERAALRLAEALVTKHEVDDETYEELIQHFSKAEIASLALLVTLINSFNWLNETFHTTPGYYQPAAVAKEASLQ